MLYVISSQLTFSITVHQSPWVGRWPQYDPASIPTMKHAASQVTPILTQLGKLLGLAMWLFYLSNPNTASRIWLNWHHTLLKYLGPCNIFYYQRHSSILLSFTYQFNTHTWQLYRGTLYRDFIVEGENYQLNVIMPDFFVMELVHFV